LEKYFVTIFGIGFSKFAPGTLGSIFGVLFFYFCYSFFSKNYILFFLFIFLIFIFSWYYTYVYILKNKIHDPSEIIIDEFLGQLISLTPILFLNIFKLEKVNLFELMVLSFLLFRFFDIFKPWPIYIVDKLRTSLSILLDDVIAGIFSSTILFIYLLWI
jgi:phosphatidylglycerophosphatase A